MSDPTGKAARVARSRAACVGCRSTKQVSSCFQLQVRPSLIYADRRSFPSKEMRWTQRDSLPQVPALRHRVRVPSFIWTCTIEARRSASSSDKLGADPSSVRSSTAFFDSGQPCERSVSSPRRISTLTEPTRYHPTASARSRSASSRSNPPFLASTSPLMATRTLTFRKIQPPPSPHSITAPPPPTPPPCTPTPKIRRPSVTMPSRKTPCRPFPMLWD